MKIIIENTSKMVELNGVPARVWEGETSTGIPVHCFITRIAIDKDDPTAVEQFDRELAEQKPPSPAVDQVYPLRLIL
jgi:hypothetical protein